MSSPLYGPQSETKHSAYIDALKALIDEERERNARLLKQLNEANEKVHKLTGKYSMLVQKGKRLQSIFVEKADVYQAVQHLSEGDCALMRVFIKPAPSNVKGLMRFVESIE